MKTWQCGLLLKASAANFGAYSSSLLSSLGSFQLASRALMTSASHFLSGPRYSFRHETGVHWLVSV